MDLKSFLGGLSVGRGTSGNFKLSFVGDRMELAVKSPDGQFYARDGSGLRNVTGATLDAFDGMIVKLPTPQVGKGDVIVVSENPFNAVFVEDVASDGQVRVLNTAITAQVPYVQPKNLLGQRLFVKAASLFESLGDDTARFPLPLLLILSSDSSSSQADLLPLLLLSQSQTNGGSLNSPLLLALLLREGAGQTRDGLETLLLMQALGETLGAAPKKTQPSTSNAGTEKHN